MFILFETKICNFNLIVIHNKYENIFSFKGLNKIYFIG
jgi:hypothetical protein